MLDKSGSEWGAVVVWRQTGVNEVVNSWRDSCIGRERHGPQQPWCFSLSPGLETDWYIRFLTPFSRNIYESSIWATNGFLSGKYLPHLHHSHPRRFGFPNAVGSSGVILRAGMVVWKVRGAN